MSDVIKLSSPRTREFWEIPVLFDDEHLLALDKPSGLSTSPDRYDPQRPSLMELFQRDLQRGSTWVKERRVAYLAHAYRLDFETSGVILLAKDKPTLIALVSQFGSEKPCKIYVALVHGTPAQETFLVEAKLAFHPVKTGTVRVDKTQGKKAATNFKMMQHFRGYCLLKCEPWTGRTHQIRVHLQSQGLPIVGDRIYGGRPLFLSSLKSDYRFKANREERPLIGRAALHAEQLSIVHPTLGSKVQISAPWPKDLKAAVRYLGKYAAAS